MLRKVLIKCWLIYHVVITKLLWGEINHASGLRHYVVAKAGHVYCTCEGRRVEVHEVGRVYGNAV